MYLVKPLSWDKGSGRYTKSPPALLALQIPWDEEQRGRGGVSTRYLVPGGGLYQIHCQSRDRGLSNRSGGAQIGECLTPPFANPLVAERAFRASEYWGPTRVSKVHGK